MTKMSVIYTQTDEGWSDWILPLMRGYRLGCCDCGLSNDFEFQLLKKKVIVSAKEYRIRFACRKEYYRNIPNMIQTGVLSWEDWVYHKPNRKFFLKCSGCHLVHAFAFQVLQVVSSNHGQYSFFPLKKSSLVLRVRSKCNARSTSQLRRKKFSIYQRRKNRDDKK